MDNQRTKIPEIAVKNYNYSQTIKTLTPEKDADGNPIPSGTLLSVSDSGLYFGEYPRCERLHYVGAKQGFEGNVIIIGGNGSGKSSSILMPSLATWRAPACITDIKGEHSECYAKLYAERLVTRPYIVFDPTDPESPSYDPFWILDHDSKFRLVANVREIANTIIPDPGIKDNSFWIESEQSILAAALLFFYKAGLSFSQTICLALDYTLKALYRLLKDSDDPDVKAFFGSDIAPETLASIERGFRNKLVQFANDPFISHAFRGEREGAKCFNWEDLENYQIFIKIPDYQIDLWGSAINLIYSQLIHYLQRRPEKHSEAGENKLPVILFMDEFARFSKLDVITSALATLRSKQVNICLFVQSVAQLDKIYGVENRRIIFDNCQHRVILRATDPETQKYLADMVGTQLQFHMGKNESYDNSDDRNGYSLQHNQAREFIVQPHEFAFLQDIILLNPDSCIRIEKHRINYERLKNRKFGNHRVFAQVPVKKEAKSQLAPINSSEMLKNIDAKMLETSERYQQAKNIFLKGLKPKNTKKDTSASEKFELAKGDYIGSVLLDAFPEFKALKCGKASQLAIDLFPIEAFLRTIANDRDAVKQIAELAGCSDLFEKS